MLHEPVVLDCEARVVVSDVIRLACADNGRWLHAVNARTNHVHVVLTASLSPETATGTFKARSTLVLRRRGFISPEQPVWARHGSSRYLWTEAHVQAAVRYVRDGQ